MVVMFSLPLVADADKVITETLGDLVGFAGDDRCHVDAHQHRLVGLDCYQTVALPGPRENTRRQKSQLCQQTIARLLLQKHPAKGGTS